jgi:hypothetical protein
MCPMRANSYQVWGRFLVGGLCAFVLGTVCAPGQARAGCGNHQLPLPAKSLSPKEASVTSPAVPHPPCSAPSCSRQPLAPPAVPVSAPVRDVDDLAALSSPPLSVCPRPLPRLVGDPVPLPVRRGTDVFHPPR